MKRIWAILRLRCPVCLEGRAFHSLFGMNKVCPECGIAFEREHGYFLNSMFIAYALGFLIMVPTAILLALRDVSITFFALFMVALVVVITPILFRYSRILWLHTDQILDPRPLPGTSSDTPAAFAANESAETTGGAESTEGNNP